MTEQAIETNNSAIYENAYQVQCAAPREAFRNHPVIKELFLTDLDDDFLELFMVSWSALSAGLTAPIPEFLTRAGINCRKIGLTTMAEFFELHTEEEDGHDDWAITDTSNLVNRWNSEHPEYQLSAEKLLENKFSPAVKRYHALHAGVVDGEQPWAELAIDVEIELITTQYGPDLLSKCVKSMGEESLENVSMLRDHVKFDFGHTDTNFAVIHQLLLEHPEFLDVLVETGKRALESYGDFLDDVMADAKRMYAELQAATAASATA